MAGSALKCAEGDKIADCLPRERRVNRTFATNRGIRAGHDKHYATVQVGALALMRQQQCRVSKRRTKAVWPIRHASPPEKRVGHSTVHTGNGSVGLYAEQEKCERKQPQ